MLSLGAFWSEWSTHLAVIWCAGELSSPICSHIHECQILSAASRIPACPCQMKGVGHHDRGHLVCMKSNAVLIITIIIFCAKLWQLWVVLAYFWEGGGATRVTQQARCIRAENRMTAAFWSAEQRKRPELHECSTGCATMWTSTLNMGQCITAGAMEVKVLKQDLWNAKKYRVEFQTERLLFDSKLLSPNCSGNNVKLCKIVSWK